jgi:K+-transporting ATPase ATPase C chain
MYLWMTFLTGILYPLLITGIAQLTLKQKANGNFVSKQERIVGATLVAQKFERNDYFWPRPSSIDYQPMPSGGSNLGPTSAALKKVIEERKQKILKAHNVDVDTIPAELLFASGSGIDPHISVEAAYFQMERVGKARAMDNKVLKSLIDGMIIKRRWGFLGEAYVNVLMLNLALDKRKIGS